MTDKRQATIGHEYPCFAGDGEAARMMRATDWAATPLGPVEGWPPGLCSIVATSKATANARAPPACALPGQARRPGAPLALMAAFGADAGPAQRQSPDGSAMAPLS